MTPNVKIWFIKIAIPTRVNFISRQKFLVKVGIGGHLVLGTFNEHATRSIAIRLQFLNELDFLKAQSNIIRQSLPLSV